MKCNWDKKNERFILKPSDMNDNKSICVRPKDTLRGLIFNAAWKGNRLRLTFDESENENNDLIRKSIFPGFFVWGPAIVNRIESSMHNSSKSGVHRLSRTTRAPGQGRVEISCCDHGTVIKEIIGVKHSKCRVKISSDENGGPDHEYEFKKVNEPVSSNNSPSFTGKFSKPNVLEIIKMFENCLLRKDDQILCIQTGMEFKVEEFIDCELQQDTSDPFVECEIPKLNKENSEFLQSEFLVSFSSQRSWLSTAKSDICKMYSKGCNFIRDFMFDPCRKLYQNMCSVNNFSSNQSSCALTSCISSSDKSESYNPNFNEMWHCFHEAKRSKAFRNILLEVILNITQSDESLDTLMEWYWVRYWTGIGKVSFKTLKNNLEEIQDLVKNATIEPNFKADNASIEPDNLEFLKCRHRELHDKLHALKEASNALKEASRSANDFSIIDIIASLENEITKLAALEKMDKYVYSQHQFEDLDELLCKADMISQCMDKVIDIKLTEFRVGCESFHKNMVDDLREKIKKQTQSESDEEISSERMVEFVQEEFEGEFSGKCTLKVEDIDKSAHMQTKLRDGSGFFFQKVIEGLKNRIEDQWKKKESLLEAAPPSTIADERYMPDLQKLSLRHRFTCYALMAQIIECYKNIERTCKSRDERTSFEDTLQLLKVHVDDPNRVQDDIECSSRQWQEDKIFFKMYAEHAEELFPPSPQRSRKLDEMVFEIYRQKREPLGSASDYIAATRVHEIEMDKKKIYVTRRIICGQKGSPL